MRFLLHRRGFDQAVVARPMTALPPGLVSQDDIAPDPPAGDFQPDAWLVWTEPAASGFWEYSASAPADARAAAQQEYLLHTFATGRFISN